MVMLRLLAICGISYIAIVVAPAGVEQVALQPLASQLGTTASKAAVVGYVTAALEDYEGTSQGEVHAFLDSIGAFMYRGPYPSGNGETIENAYWTLAELPFRKIRAIWILRYDSAGHLVEVGSGES
jgi:hypothetical protein